MKINCHAKINIGLEILNKRPDNYHNINTNFYKISLFDELLLEKADSFEFIFNSDLKLDVKDNIAFRAAMMFKDEYGLKNLPVKITINKNIPAGAGLGGGSTDAAGVIRGLTDFLGINRNYDINSKIALTLGSDVPFFLNDSNAAIGKGRGEILEHFDIELPYHILLVFPGIHVSTSLAYSSLKRNSVSLQPTDYLSAIDVLLNQPEKIKDIFVNQFEVPVFEMHPSLQLIKFALISSGAVYASMSGSGSTIYGFFQDRQSALNATEQIGEYKTFVHSPE